MRFDPSVNAPGGMSYAAPLLPFMQLGELGNDFYQGRKDQFYEQQRQRDLMLQQPINANNPQDAMKELMQRGGGPYALPLMEFQLLAQKQQQQQNRSSLVGGDQQPSSGPSGGPQAAQPASPGRPNIGVGVGTATITDIVSSKLDTTAAASQAMMNRIANVMKTDPTAPLSEGQERRAMAHQ
jgi:hypothetical protein